jgi:hypothetical protein
MILVSCHSVSSERTIIKWVSDSKGRKVKKEEEKQYDSKGNLIKWMQYTGEGQICEIFNYNYYQDRVIKKSRGYCNGKGNVETIYSYDKSGRMMSWIERDMSNNRSTKHINKYNGVSKHIADTENFDEKGNLYERTTFEYYQSNLLKKETQFVDGSWFLSIEYRYDKRKNLIFEGAEAEGGVGFVKSYYTYKDNVLIKDKIEIPGDTTQYHIYEITKN